MGGRQGVARVNMEAREKARITHHKVRWVNNPSDSPCKTRWFSRPHIYVHGVHVVQGGSRLKGADVIYSHWCLGDYVCGEWSHEVSGTSQNASSPPHMNDCMMVGLSSSK